MPTKIQCKIGRGRYIRTPEIKEKNKKASIGHRASQSQRDKVSEFMIKWHREHIHPRQGKKHSQATKEKMSRDRTGAGGANWQGGKTLTVRLFRKSRQYQQWRKVILKRDNYLCQVRSCGEKSNLVHHKLSVKDYPDLRLVIENGMVVCKKHHNQIHSFLLLHLVACGMSHKILLH